MHAGAQRGDRAIDLSGALTLDHGPGGLGAGPFPRSSVRLSAPGQSEPVTVKLNKALPAGPWHARIQLRSGLIQRAAEGTITFPSAAGTCRDPGQGETRAVHEEPACARAARDRLILLLLSG